MSCTAVSSLPGSAFTTEADIRFRENKGLAFRLARDFRSRGARVGMGLEGIEQLALLALWRAAEAFDPGRGVKFAAFAWELISWRLLHALRASRHTHWLASGRMEPWPRSETGELDVEDHRGQEQRLEDQEQAERLLNGLRAREREMLALRFGLVDGRAWSFPQIGERFGLSWQRVDQIVQAALQRLRATAERERAAG
jgi:RNA polymerase sporulation-specific sigma factor